MKLLRIALLGLWCWFVNAPVLHAADNLRVMVVLSDPGSLYRNFATTYRQDLPPNAQVGVAERAEDFVASGQAVDLVVSVGTKAAESVAGRTSAPMLAAMIPRVKYAELLAKRPPAAQTSAIYIDQPWARQVDLLRAALPERTKIGLLHSQATRLDVNDLRRQLAAHGANLVAKQTASPANLFGDLEEVLSSSEVLLAVPDSEVYNNNNIRNILLTSYRHGIPLVGFSQALVNAGALLAVFSTPEQLAAQASAITSSFAQLRRLPDPQSPVLYSIAVNQEVARTLGGTVKSAELLQLQLDKSQRLPR